MLKSMRKSQNRYFYHIVVSPGDARGAITLNVVWMESEFDAHKLSRSMYPSIFNSFPVIRTACAKKSSFSRTAAHIFVSPGDACESCHQCQKKRRVTVYDRVPITPIPRGDDPFDLSVMDCLGPLFSNQKVEYNYALVLCDSNTRYPFAVPLRTLTAKKCVQCFIAGFSASWHSIDDKIGLR